ncbi:DUF167 family protein [Methanobacterium paludis]|uniref:UPF0235 protein MSWAN_0547 n=1 Tax=Methanobacterium paludis (strain DSM 25820 / JCM 18151 / SWAN1) TaxID=868131 RepID=F6D550_METPW|nr:DUF167 family protein [Methanobacterium paludis]AEG17585.1 UPF0235 protein yggU [Methanobacterium paludis]
MQAVKESGEGILVDIEVSPKSGKFEIAGYNEWREAIEVKIKAVPQKGKANKEIIKEFSKLTKNPVEIISGHKSHRKTIKIYNMAKTEFLKILDSYF